MCKMLLHTITVKEGKFSHISSPREEVGQAATGAVFKQEHDLLLGTLKSEDEDSACLQKEADTVGHSGAAGL